jgi:magnesium chelatase subunit I
MRFAKTLGELVESGYRSRSVKDEMRANLISKLQSGEKLFPGIIGYTDTVIPHIVNAVLARHNLILLGLRGQAKTRIMRQLADLLDEYIPVIEGSELNDDPLNPVSAFGRRMVEAEGRHTPVRWIHRDIRYVEKLATPDVTIADIIGDIDPIKAAKSGSLLSDEATMHYGLLPRANRGIFAINELPDLAGKIQVGLFNIMQEGDVQIKGYPVRLPLDVVLLFSANPEDYTARGKIITPLKDRINAEIMTHYPTEIESAVEITRSEAWTDRDGLDVHLFVPEFIREMIEQIAFEARDDQRIDKRSGVSQRLPISVLETVISNAERRALITLERDVVPRISDLYTSIPSITGKMELEYEGEQVGALKIAKDLIKRSCGEVFEEYFTGIDFSRTIQWFDEGNSIRLSDSASSEECLILLEPVPDLVSTAVVPFDFDQESPSEVVSACEFVLEGLYAQNKITRNEEGGYTAKTKAKKERRGMIYDDLSETGRFS